MNAALALLKVQVGYGCIRSVGNVLMLKRPNPKLGMPKCLHAPAEQRLRSRLAPVLLASLVGLSVALAEGVWPKPVFAQQSAPSAVRSLERVLTVTGSGRQSIPTTLTQVNLGVVIEADTADAAQQQVAQRQTAVIEWLRSQNVEKLETTGISLNPRYDYINDRQVLRGYQATNTVSFRIATEQAGTVIDGAISAGATRIDRVSFVAEDDAITAARQEALVLAVADAQQQADTVLGALGLSQEEIVGITIGSVSLPPPVFARARQASLVEADASTPVEGRSQVVNAQVTLEIRY